MLTERKRIILEHQCYKHLSVAYAICNCVWLPRWRVNRICYLLTDVHTQPTVGALDYKTRWTEATYKKLCEYYRVQKSAYTCDLYKFNYFSFLKALKFVSITKKKTKKNKFPGQTCYSWR